MRLVSLHAAIAAVCLLSTVGSARAAVTPEENVVVFARTFSDQLINRRIVYLRPRVLPATPAPAMLLLPYRNRDADDMADHVHAASLVRKYNTWVIIPEAINGYWTYKQDRKSVVKGKRGAERVDLVGGRIIKKKN